MGGTKRTAEEEDFDPDFDDMPVDEDIIPGPPAPVIPKPRATAVSATGATTTAAAAEKIPTPINDLRNNDHFEKMNASSRSLINVIHKSGLNKPTIYESRDSEQVAAVYKYLTTSGCVKIKVYVDIYKGSVVSVNTMATKMSGAKEILPEDIELICVAAILYGRPEVDSDYQFLVDSFDVDATFTIDDDGKLRMMYTVRRPNSAATIHLDTYVTILDPDLIL